MSHRSIYRIKTAFNVSEKLLSFYEVCTSYRRFTTFYREGRFQISAWVVNFLSRFMQCPTKQHWIYAKQVLNYANCTNHRKLHLGKFNDDQLTGYVDASYGMSPDGRSQSGMVFTLFGSVVSWASRKQETVSKSTTEAEYVSLSTAIDECLWIKQLLIDWGLRFTAPTTLFEDNQAVIKLVHTGQVNTRAKYLSTKLKSANEYILRGHIKVQYIASRDQWADMLTKTKVPLNVDQLFQGLGDSTTRGSVEMAVSSSKDKTKQEDSISCIERVMSSDERA